MKKLSTEFEAYQFEDRGHCFFLIKNNVIYTVLRKKWFERLIFWEKGKAWTRKRAFERWLKILSMPYV